MTTTICTITHGSHLFGTATERSDTDIKSVVIPAPRDILLGNVDRSWIEQTKLDLTATNTSSDIDNEFHDILRFMRLLASGQPVAIEMLFAPREFHHVDPHPIWDQIVANTDRLVSKEAGKFLGYCRRQAAAYGMKGARLATAEDFLERMQALVKLGARERMTVHFDELVKTYEDNPHVSVEFREMPNGKAIRHISVCDRMIADTITVQDAAAIANAIVREYGERSRRTMQSNGNDWKALSHAVRVGYEAVDLFTTGRLELPLRQAPRLLAIKNGKIAHEEVGDEIVDILDRVELAARTSPLREAADQDYMDDVVIEAHSDVLGQNHVPSLA